MSAWWPEEPREMNAAIDEALRGLVLKGYIEARIIDGELRYRITEKGKDALENGREQFYDDNPEFT